ncbi:hypothetical protein AVEN_233782-1 [Araneus ventricosus]|uniref:Uncharacterized protein n=1 Tax=Araneus ventricosus TaxID=182803 RepID=A0A4Y2IBQ3_ARAVE|nr:hypothetical protein AVEN_233782-1 [Araneus ventricosus]
MVRQESPWPAEGSRASRTVFFLDHYLRSTHPLPLPFAVFCLLFSDLSVITREHCQSYNQQTSRFDLKENYILKKYDQLPKLSQWEAASMLNISQLLRNSLLKFRSDIETAVQKNDNLMRKRCWKDEDVKDLLKE